MEADNAGNGCRSAEIRDDVGQLEPDWSTSERLNTGAISTDRPTDRVHDVVI